MKTTSTPPIQFGRSYNMLAGKSPTARMAQVTNAVLGSPGRLESGLANKNWFVAKARRVLSSLLGYDFTEVRQMGRFKVVDPPFGAILFLLYPITIGARYLRAKQRDRANNTDVEQKDVMRRDFATITLFLYAVPPLKNFLTWINQKRSGIRLLPDAPKGRLFASAYTYQELTDSLTFNRPQVLEALIVDGNGKGVPKSIKRLQKYYRLVLQKHGLEASEQEILKKIDSAHNNLSQAVREQQVTGLRRNDNITALTHAAFDELEHAQGAFVKLKGIVGQSEDFNKMFKPAHRLLRGLNMKDSVADFAKMKRMPADFLAFLTVVFALGWFPVWFNDLLSRNRRKQESTQAMQQNIMLSVPPSQIKPSPFQLVKPQI